MTNLSKDKRDKMITFLEKLKSKCNDDRSIGDLNEIKNYLLDKKYGLVWEEHSENVDKTIKDYIPIFTEDKDRKIVRDKNLPYNFILEGDNLQSLLLLEKTHRGRIDVIYIDPPYNTGSGDFVYNDKIVEKEDSYLHSKWLSFMNKRLRIAKNLLSDEGVIFISIDDNEQANLKLLCDEIFGDENKIAILPTIMNLKGNQDEFGFAGTHEYTLVYSKKKNSVTIGEFEIDEDDLDEWEFDEIGYYKQGATLKRTGQDAPRERRPWSYYPILVDENNRISTITEDEYIQIYNKDERTFNDNFVDTLKKKYEEMNYTFILPLADNNVKTSWRWQYKKVTNEKSEIIVVNGRNGLSLYKKQRPELSDLPTKKPKSLFYKATYSSGNGTNRLKDILGSPGLFNNPKPVELLKDFIFLAGNRECIVLDFFAGSGTTADAVVNLNTIDNGRRKFILCTNNEIKDNDKIEYFVDKGYISKRPKKGTNAEKDWIANWNNFVQTDEYKSEIKTEDYQILGICHKVTYPRVKTVITGKRQDGSIYSDGLVANVKYFKCDWTPRKPEDYLLSNALCLHIKEMIELQNAIEIDQIKNVLILNKDDLKKTVLNDEIYKKIEKIWVNQNILLNAKEMDLLKNKGFAYIPKGFFGQELKEVAE